MIDWLAASRCAAQLNEDSGRTDAALASAVDAASCFQNTSFPLSPLPLYASRSATAAVAPVLERYVAMLGRIIGLYRQHQEIRDYYRLGPAAEALIAADTRLGDTVSVCRLDGYLEQGTERLVLLENNADAPAGTLFSSRVNGVVLDALARTGTSTPELSDLTLTDETALLDLLLSVLDSAGQRRGDARVAILQFAGRANRESLEMAEVFRAAGVPSIVADPRDLQLRGGRVCFGGEQVDVCWNKVNTVGWRTAVESDPELVARWVRALSEGDFVHVNSFGARYVAESKLTLALVHEPAFASCFSDEDRALVGQVLPWARRLTATALAEDGHTPLAIDVLDRPADYVLKQPYDIRGDGVTIGRASSRTAWDKAVAEAAAAQLTVQRYTAPTAYPVMRSGQHPGMVAMPVSFDTFVLGGRVRGFGSKASLNARLNVFQGGQKLAVHICEDS